MKNIFKSLAVVFVLGLVASSCEKEDALKSESYIIDKPINENDVDRYIAKTFTNTFNIAIDYRWDRNNYGTGLDNKRNLYPSKLENVQPALEMVDKVWIQSYVDVAGKDFVRKIRPGRFLIAGGYALNDNGTRTLGLASGGVQVTLYEVDFLQEDVSSARQFIHTIQHEYIHIINQDTPFNELEFGEKSFADYNAMWHLLDRKLETSGFDINTYGNVLGFVTGYARSNIMEDFAETASYMLTQKPAVYQAMLAKVRSYEAMTPAQRDAIGLTSDFYKTGGADIIERKVGLVRAYFKSLNIDFDELARVANKNADESPMLNPGGSQGIINKAVFGKMSINGVATKNIRYCQGHADVSGKTGLNN